MKHRILKCVVFSLAATLSLPGTGFAEESGEVLKRISDLEKKVQRVEELENEVLALKKQLELKHVPEEVSSGPDTLAKKSGEFSEKKLQNV